MNIVDNENLQISIKAGMVLSIEEENITVVVFNQTYKADISSARITNAKWINLDKELIKSKENHVRWIGSNALVELKSEAVQKRLKKEQERL